MVGIPDCADWQRGRCGHFILDWPNHRAALAATSSRKIEEPPRVGTGGRTRGVEAHSSQPITSALSYQLDELLIWADQDSLSHLHDLDCDRTGARTLSLRLPWDAGTIRSAPGPRTNTSASVRILGLGRRATCFPGHPDAGGADRIARSST